MADTAVAITAGTGTNIDTRTEATNGNHRQVIVVGDPSTNAAVATVTDGAPSATDYALVVGIHPDSQNANGRAAAASSAPAVLSDEDLAVLTAIETAVELIDNAISGSEMQVDVVAALPAGTNAIGKLAANAGVNIGDVSSQPSATGGLSVFRSLDLDESEEEVKATAGCLYKIRATNRTTSVRYLKLYNATAANTTVGTTTPIDTIPLPANASDYTVLTESFGGLGLTFDTALSMAVTTGFADNDTGAPGANDVIVSAYYK